jgi:uncharacterized protein (TIGR00251 family)
MGGERLVVRVSPGASRTEVAGRMADGRLKVRVAAPAEDGRANAALIKLLARELGVDARDVTLVAGHGARDKIVEVAAPAERVRALGMRKEAKG